MSQLLWLILTVVGLIVGAVVWAGIVDRRNRARHRDKRAMQELAEFADHPTFRWDDREQR